MLDNGLFVDVASVTLPRAVAFIQDNDIAASLDVDTG